jgi:hypothetical protein
MESVARAVTFYSAGQRAVQHVGIVRIDSFLHLMTSFDARPRARPDKLRATHTGEPLVRIAPSIRRLV